MEEPREELTADADERSEAPDFEALTPPEELVCGDRTRDDFSTPSLPLIVQQRRTTSPNSRDTVSMPHVSTWTGSNGWES